MIDISTNDHLIGAEHVAGDADSKQISTTDNFNGFLWSLKIYATEIKDWLNEITTSVTCPNGCTVCPMGGCFGSLGECVSNCDLNQFLPDCESCPLECSDGCVRAENCSPCEDDECEICSGFGADQCTQCIDNASGTDDCECDPPFYFVIETHSCNECHPYCLVCTDTTNSSCSECRDGFFKQPGSSICLPQCPEGFTSVGKECTGTVDQVFCLTFDRIQYDWVVSDDITAIGGANANPSNDVSQVEASDPRPIFKRGLWFDGDDFLNVTGLVLNHSFTIRAWVRPSSDGNLLSVNQSIYTGVDSECWLNYNIIGASTQIKYSDGRTPYFALSGLGNSLALQDWQQVTAATSYREDN